VEKQNLLFVNPYKQVSKKNKVLGFMLCAVFLAVCIVAIVMNFKDTIQNFSL
jgi:uncharacterized membrane protein YwzB